MRTYDKILAASVLTVMSTALAALAASSPEQTCQAAKNKEAGKYALCRQKAEAGLAKTGDPAKYGQKLVRCMEKLQTKWQTAIDKAGLAGTTCLDETLSESDYRTLIDAASDSIAAATAGGSLGMCTGGLGPCADELVACEADLAACEATPKPPAQPLKTGQVSCYELDNDSLNLIPCVGTGQDGDIQAGAARSYVDNGDGTISDIATGLMWEKLSDDGSVHDVDSVYTWKNASTVKIAGLNADGGFAGYGDWRLPNANELTSIVHYGASAPAVAGVFNSSCTAGCTVLTCSCTNATIHWTSTTDVDFVNEARIINFANAVDNTRPKTDLRHVRAVRGGLGAPGGAGGGTCEQDLAACQADLAACEAVPTAQPLMTGQVTCYDPDTTGLIPCEGTGQDGEFQAGRARGYLDNGDGTVTDTATGLMWERLSDDGSIHDVDDELSYEDAFVAKLTALNGGGGFAGHTDWRMPNANELQTLLHRGTSDPAIDPVFHNGCVPACSGLDCGCIETSSWYWSSTTAVDSGGVFVSDFVAGGYRHEGGHSGNYHLLAVRGP